MKFLYVAIASMLLAGCSGQMITRKFGGTTTLNLTCNNTLKTIAWDSEHNLWYLEEPVYISGWIPQTYQYKEQSQWGLFQGSITVVEGKCK